MRGPGDPLLASSARRPPPLAGEESARSAQERVPGRGPARNRACPISNFLVPSRQQPTWWLASLAPQDDGNYAAAAARPTACRRPAVEDRARLSTSAPFAAELRPIVEPFPDLTLEAAFGRIVELLAAERFREIVLSGERVFAVVVVFVA